MYVKPQDDTYKSSHGFVVVFLKRFRGYVGVGGLSVMVGRIVMIGFIQLSILRHRCCWWYIKRCLPRAEG